MDAKSDLTSQPEELKWEMASYLDENSLIQLCKTDTNFRRLCNNYDFMMRWVKIHHPELTKLLESYTITHPNLTFFESLFNVRNHVKLGELITVDSFKFYNLNRCAIMAGRQQNIDLFLFYVSVLSNLENEATIYFLRGLVESIQYLKDINGIPLLDNQSVNFEYYINRIVNLFKTDEQKLTMNDKLNSSLDIIQKAFNNIPVIDPNGYQNDLSMKLMVYYHGMGANLVIKAPQTLEYINKHSLTKLLHNFRFDEFYKLLESTPLTLDYLRFALKEACINYQFRSQLIEFVKLYDSKVILWNDRDGLFTGIFNTGDVNLILSGEYYSERNFIPNFSLISILDKLPRLVKMVKDNVISQFIANYYKSKLLDTYLINSDYIPKYLREKFTRDELLTNIFLSYRAKDLNILLDQFKLEIERILDSA